MGIGRHAWIACAVIAAAAAMSGCGNGAPQTKGMVLGVTERDFHIRAPDRVPAGTVTVRIHNAGPDTHELFLVRASSPKLPLRSDGMTVDEDAIATATVASMDTITPGSTRDEHLNLRPGRYLLFCNMAGHFRGGMHRELVVT